MTKKNKLRDNNITRIKSFFSHGDVPPPLKGIPRDVRAFVLGCCVIPNNKIRKLYGDEGLEKTCLFGIKTNSWLRP